MDAGYKFGIVHNGLHGVDLELGHGHSMGLAGWLLGVNIQSYFPTGNFNLYVQPKLSVFLPLNLFSSGYLWQLGEMERPAIYQLSYGYNFQVTNTLQQEFTNIKLRYPGSLTCDSKMKRIKKGGDN